MGRKYTDICEVESVLKLSSDIFLTFLGRRKKYYQLRQMMGEEVWEVWEETTMYKMIIRRMEKWQSREMWQAICERFQNGHKITGYPVQCIFGGLTLPCNVFYLFYNSERKRKLLRMQMILNHWNANELCPVQRNRFVLFFSSVDKPGFFFFFFFVSSSMRYNWHTMKFSHDKTILHPFINPFYHFLLPMHTWFFEFYFEQVGTFYWFPH